MFPGNKHGVDTYCMDNMDRDRAQLLLFTIVQCEGAINYYDEDGNTRDYGGNYKHIHLDGEIKGEKEGEQELKLSSDKSVQLVQTKCTKQHCRYEPLISHDTKKYVVATVTWKPNTVQRRFP